MSSRFHQSELLLAVLALLEEGPFDGREIAAELGLLLASGRRLRRDSVYPAVEALEAEGLIARLDRDGSAVYRATQAGSAALAKRSDAPILERLRGRPRQRRRRDRAACGPRAVAVLFTDVVASTVLFERFGAQAAHELRRRHFALLRHAVADHGGHEVKSLGDGLMVVFEDPSAAVRCACTIQRAVVACGDPIALRIGIDVGTALEEEGDYFGGPVIVARRLCDSASGGQIVVSNALLGLVGDRFPFDELGGLVLKGLGDQVQASAVRWRPPDPMRDAARLQMVRSESRPRCGSDPGAGELARAAAP